MLKFQPKIRFDAKGLVPVIVQDAGTNEVLMLAYMNAEALRLTISTGETHFWSRSRQELWHKGSTSGHVQRVVNIRLDCDADALLVQVLPAGSACHTGERSCFYETMQITLQDAVLQKQSSDSNAELTK